MSIPTIPTLPQNVCVIVFCVLGADRRHLSSPQLLPYSFGPGNLGAEAEKEEPMADNR